MKDNLKSVLLMFAVIFSVVFVPVLVLLPSVGGAAAAVAEMTAPERLEEIAEESGIAEIVYAAVLEEMAERVSVTQLKPEVTERIVKDSLQIEDFEQWIKLLLEGVYTGNAVTLDLSEQQERAEKQVEELLRDGFDEVYAVWRDGADTVNFSGEYVEELFTDWENDFLNQYEMYGARDLESLEQVYDETHGEGKFESLREQKINELREEWDGEITENIKILVADRFAEIEAEAEARLQELVKNSDVRENFDFIQKVGKWSGSAKLAVYGILAVIVLLLLALYRFEIPGFVVTAVSLLAGGGLCKLMASLDGRIAEWIHEAAFAGLGENEKTLSISASLLENVLKRLLDSISAVGTVSLIAALALTGGAILRGVLKADERAAKESCRQ